MNSLPTLICIPDISGFTQFMSETDLEISGKVIPSLLNKIIYSNEIGLKISEIEGDAVLFYKSGELPSFRNLVDQCRNFYTDFYKKMHSLNGELGEKWKEIEIPEMLGLKIILHFGQEVGMAPIGKSIKLMGEDVIIAHRLLKNNIPFDEYILFSEDLISQYDTNGFDDLDWAHLQEGDIHVEHVGNVKFRYINLKPLVNEV